MPLRWPSQQERSPCMLIVVCSNHGRIKTKFIKQVVTTILPNARQQVRVSRILGDNHINGCPVSLYVWHANEPLLLNGHDCRV